MKYGEEKMRRRMIAVLMIAPILAISLAACSGSAEKKAADAVPVVTGTMKKVQELETISVSGTISTPESPATVSFLVSGKVVFVGPREGDSVTRGQKLASIELTDYQLSLAAAEAQTKMTLVAYNRAADEHRRMKMLYDLKSLAGNDYEKFKAAFDSAEQQFEQTRASEKLTRKRLQDATLYSPVTGFISRRSVEPGDTAAAGEPVFEIVQMNPLEVNVGVPETDIHLVRIGQKAEITVPAIPAKTFEGTVRVINVSADSGTRTYMTRITVPNPEHFLRVGMVAEAAIRGDRMRSIVTLPGDAIVRDPQGATQVFVYYPDQKRVYTRRVEVGAAVNRDVEIKSGLSGNELVVLAGQTMLRNGQTVSTTQQTAAK